MGTEATRTHTHTHMVFNACWPALRPILKGSRAGSGSPPFCVGVPVGSHVACFLCKCHKLRFCHLVALFVPSILTMILFSNLPESLENCAVNTPAHTYHPRCTTVSIFPYLLSHTFFLTVHQSIFFVCLLLMHFKVMLQPSGLVSDISHKG